MAYENPNEASLFSAARTIESAEQRDAFLTEACGGDDSLRKRVEELLAVQSDPTEVIC